MQDRLKEIRDRLEHESDIPLKVCARNDIEFLMDALREALIEQKEWVYNRCLDCEATCSRQEGESYCNCDTPKRIRIIAEALQAVK